MKSLTKEERNQLEDFIVQLNDASSKIETRVTEVNEAIVELNDAIQGYNNILHNVMAFQADIVGRMEEYAQGKPEDWEESDEGSAWEEWHQSWQMAHLENIDLIDDVSVGEMDHASQLDEIGDSP